MGVFEVEIGVQNGNGGPVELVTATVDTGATYTVLPDALLRERVGILPNITEDFTLGDGSVRRYGTGQALLSIEGREFVSRVVFGNEDQYLLGATTLQVFGLIPDTTNHRLIPAPKLLI